MSVLSELETKMTELEAEKKAILAARDEAIKTAKETYVASLKEINAKMGRVKRMTKTATEKL